MMCVWSTGSWDRELTVNDSKESGRRRRRWWWWTCAVYWSRISFHSFLLTLLCDASRLRLPITSSSQVHSGHSPDDRPYARPLLANHLALRRTYIDQCAPRGFHHPPILWSACLSRLECPRGIYFYWYFLGFLIDARVGIRFEWKRPWT